MYYYSSHPSTSDPSNFREQFDFKHSMKMEALSKEFESVTLWFFWISPLLLLLSNFLFRVPMIAVGDGWWQRRYLMNSWRRWSRWRCFFGRFGLLSIPLSVKLMKKKKKKKRQQLYAEWDAKQTKAPKETPSSAPPSSRIHEKFMIIGTQNKKLLSNKRSGGIQKNHNVTDSHSLLSASIFMLCLNSNCSRTLLGSGVDGRVE